MAQHEEEADRRAQRKAKVYAKKEKQEIDAAIAGLLQHPHGRRFLYHILAITHAVGSNPFTGDALSTAFQCGEQNVGQRIIALILDVDSEGYLTMLREAEALRKEVESELVTDEDIGPDEDG